MQVLIAHLEKNRGMKPEERANIMKTLKELTEKISHLKNEISLASQSTANTMQAKNKTDVRFVTFRIDCATWSVLSLLFSIMFCSIYKYV